MTTATARRLDLVQGTPEWLAARDQGIGSSDIPVIVRESPHKSAYALWAEKSGRAPAEPLDAATQELMDIGKRMEPVLLDLYEERTGRKARRVPRMLVHPDLPWARASLDAEAPVRRIVEAKWTHARRWSQGDPVPADVLCQVQWQMFVSGRDVVDVVALVGPELRIVDVPRDDTMIDNLLFFATDFWRHVQDGTPPEVDGSESTRGAITRAHPANDGRMLPSDPDVDALIVQLRTAEAEAAAAEELVGTCKNTLRALIGDADGIVGSWGRATWKRNADFVRTNWPAVARALRDRLQDSVPAEELDALESLHSETVAGARVLRLVSAKGA